MFYIPAGLVVSLNLVHLLFHIKSQPHPIVFLFWLLLRGHPFGVFIGSVSTYCFIRSSIPLRAMFASNGEITPPCGVPSDVGNNCSPSITPAFSQLLIWRRIVGDVFSFLSSASWLMRSKHLAMSASSTYLALHLIALNIESIAS